MKNIREVRLLHHLHFLQDSNRQLHPVSLVEFLHLGDVYTVLSVLRDREVADMHLHQHPDSRNHHQQVHWKKLGMMHQSLVAVGVGDALVLVPVPVPDLVQDAVTVDVDAAILADAEANIKRTTLQEIWEKFEKENYR